MAPRKWLFEDDKQLRALYLAGIDVPGIVVILGREESAVRRRMSTLGLLTRRTSRVGAHMDRRSGVSWSE